MFMKRSAALRDLREADPRSLAGFDPLVRQQRSVRDQIVASEPRPSSHTVRTRAARPTPRFIGLSAGAACAVAAIVVAGVLLLGGGNPGLTVTPAVAAEAAKKAAVDTSAAAGSGVISTVLMIDGEAQVMNRISWNGDDVSLLVQNDIQRQIRYVGGQYFETYGYSVPIEQGDTSHDGRWFHVTSYDKSVTTSTTAGAMEQPDPAAWLEAARTDLAGKDLVALITGARDFTQTADEDGSTTYAATTTVAAIQAADWSIAGLPSANQPSFKVQDTAAPVSIRLTVGSDGLIRELKLDWKLDLPGEAWLPRDYIPDFRAKVDVYRRLSRAAAA